MFVEGFCKHPDIAWMRKPVSMCSPKESESEMNETFILWRERKVCRKSTGRIGQSKVSFLINTSHQNMCCVAVYAIS